MNDNKNIHGVTLIELLVVIGIMGVMTGFVYPSISNWQTNKNIERDLEAYVSLLDYVTNKAKAVGGTGMIYCLWEEKKGEYAPLETYAYYPPIVSYKISRYYLKPSSSDGRFVVDSNFTNNIIKDPRNAIGTTPAENPDHNILSGKSTFLASFCKKGTSQYSGIINARGQSGVNDVARIPPDPNLDGMKVFIYAKRTAAWAHRGPTTYSGGFQLIGDDQYQDHPSYEIRTSTTGGYSTVNRKDINSGEWECAEDWYSDSMGDKNPCNP